VELYRLPTITPEAAAAIGAAPPPTLARLVLGKRAWVVFGRRIQESLAQGVQQADIGLATPRASRSHAIAMRNWKGQVFLMDLQSGNGTFLDAQRLNPLEIVPWKPGSRVVFADDQTEVFELHPSS